MRFALGLTCVLLSSCGVTGVVDDSAVVPSVEARATHTAGGEPIVGRIKLRDRVIDMTVSALEAGHEGIDLRTMKAEIMADIDQSALEAPDALDLR